MSTTLSPVEPTENFWGLEPLICDAELMVDVLYALIDDKFSKAAPERGYVVDKSEAGRLFFAAGMAIAMVRKAREAYYVAHENDIKGRAQS